VFALPKPVGRREVVLEELVHRDGIWFRPGEVSANFCRFDATVRL
jgi:hypothetical protein